MYFVSVYKKTDTHIKCTNFTQNISQAEEEGVMEEDEVEEMDVVEGEMVEVEDEDHPVQLVDEEAVVQMRQTFHQVSCFSFCILYELKEESKGYTVSYQLLKYHQSKALYKICG